MTDERVVQAQIPTAAAIAAVGSTLSNVAIYMVAERYGPLTISLTDTVVMSLIGALTAAAVYALLGRYTAYAVRWFTVAATIAIGVYGVAPIAAAYTPYREGAPLFTMPTVIATELMHIASGAWILWALIRRARQSV